MLLVSSIKQADTGIHGSSVATSFVPAYIISFDGTDGEKLEAETSPAGFFGLLRKPTCARRLVPTRHIDIRVIRATTRFLRLLAVRGSFVLSEWLIDIAYAFLKETSVLAVLNRLAGSKIVGSARDRLRLIK